MLLDEQAITAGLKKLDGWQRDGIAITKRYTFADFREAVAFIVRVAFESEQRDHHPQIYNDYDKVTLTLRTHDEGGLTEKDFELAAAIERLDAGS